MKNFGQQKYSALKLESVISILISSLIAAELINSPAVTKEIYFCMKLIMVNV